MSRFVDYTQHWEQRKKQNCNEEKANVNDNERREQRRDREREKGVFLVVPLLREVRSSNEKEQKIFCGPL
jgi:hypothetical protein